MSFLEEIHNSTGGKYAFLKEHRVNVSLKDQTVEIQLLVPFESYDAFKADDQAQVLKAARKVIPESFQLKITYKKSAASEEQFKRAFLDFLTKQFPSLVHQIDLYDLEIEISEEHANVRIKLYSHLYDYAKKFALDDQLTRYCAHEICLPCKVELVSKGDIPQEMAEGGTVSNKIIEIHDRQILTDSHELMIGKSINSYAGYIADINDVADSVACAGRVVNFTEKTSKTSGNLFYIFQLDDTTGMMTCKYFTRSAKTGPISILKDGDEVILEGPVVRDTFSHDLNILVKRLSKCKVDFDSIVAEGDYHGEEDFYQYVKPQPYQETMQIDLFQMEAGENIPVFLKGKTFVVFDLETTGLISQTDKITEIGALKICDGVVTESFSTFVNPEMAIPEEVTKKTGISYETVKDAPTIEQVFPDFYKFTRGAVLVGHNIINFDMAFINRFAKELRYKFDNKLMDTLDLSQKYMRSHNYKLVTLCKLLDIPLENAHRAIHDATANAELFKYLAKFL